MKFNWQSKFIHQISFNLQIPSAITYMNCKEHLLDLFPNCAIYGYIWIEDQRLSDKSFKGRMQDKKSEEIIIAMTILRKSHILSPLYAIYAIQPIITIII